MGRNAVFHNGLLGDTYPNHSTSFTDKKSPENINERDRKQKLGKTTTSFRGRKNVPELDRGGDCAHHDCAHANGSLS